MAEYRIGVIAIAAGKAKTSPRVVLVTSRSTGEWILPTGKHESYFSDRRIAREEAYEEAGIRGRRLRKLIGHLHVQRYRGDRSYHLKLYRLDVIKLLSVWPESHQRKRKLIGAEELPTFIHDTGLRHLIQQQLEQS